MLSTSALSTLAIFLLPCLVTADPVADISDLPDTLVKLSSSLYSDLRDQISIPIYNHPEISLNETFAHDTVVNYIQNTHSGEWTVTPHSFEEPTSWRLEFENRPDGFEGDLPAVGFFAEYDALNGVGHSCGHNLIVLASLTAGMLARQSIIDHKIPGHIIIQGTPDEENTAGKFRLDDRGAFDKSKVWMMTHPTITNAVQPMASRHTALLRISGSSHSDAVFKALSQMAIIGKVKPPGNSSTISPVEDVGLFTTAANVVQTNIGFGVGGQDIGTLNNTATQLKTSTSPEYDNVTWTLTSDDNGVGFNLSGPGGHASEGTRGVLDFAIDFFSTLNASDPSLTYFIPHNTTASELDVTYSLRTRYTHDQAAVDKSVTDVITFADKVEFDVINPALEVGPYFGKRFGDIMKLPQWDQVFPISTIAPAATDAGGVQKPIIDPDTKVLLSESKAVFHPNYGICPDASGAGCPFNHEPAFQPLAGSDLAFTQTEKMARGLAMVAVEILNDPDLMAQATALVK